MCPELAPCAWLLALDFLPHQLCKAPFLYLHHPSRATVPGIHQGAGACKLAHQSFDKVLHLAEVSLINAARAINQESNVHLLSWTLCSEGERNQMCIWASTISWGPEFLLTKPSWGTSLDFPGSF